MSSIVRSVERAGTFLFVPGDRPKRFEKAHAADPGLVVIDLEDAVAPDRKPAARVAAAEWIAAGHPCAVRINARGTAWYEDDLEMVRGLDVAVMVPKAEDAEALAGVAAVLPAGSAVIGLVETAAGVTNASRIATARGVRRLAFGTFDLAAELGISPDDTLALLTCRSALVLASAVGQLAPPVDGVTADITDPDRLRTDVAHARRLGFGGKLCIHPRQVATVAEALRPSDADIRWARSVVEASASGAVVLVEGRMVDKPVIERARRILETAEERSE